MTESKSGKWKTRIVGEGTTPIKAHKGDLVIIHQPDSLLGWSTKAMIRGVATNGMLFLNESLIALGTVVQIFRPGGKK